MKNSGALFVPQSNYIRMSGGGSHFLKFLDGVGLWLPRRRGGGGGLAWEFENSTLLWIEWISNNVLLCSIGNYVQYPVIKHNEKEYAYI